MSDERLDLEHADFGAAPRSPLACAACSTAIGSTYFTAGDQVLCQPCQMQLVSGAASGSGLGRFALALLLGGVAAVLGAGLWYAVTRLTGYEIGLIAIAVGFVVGAGVAIGSGQRGGLPYQLLAVFLSYTAICATSVPDIITAIETEQVAVQDALGGDAAPAAVDFSDIDSIAGYVVAAIFLMGFAYALPFLAGFQNVIGLLIIGFALWQAWSMNGKRNLTIEGPFEVGSASAAS